MENEQKKGILKFVRDNALILTLLINAFGWGINTYYMTHFSIASLQEESKVHAEKLEKLEDHQQTDRENSVRKDTEMDKEIVALKTRLETLYNDFKDHMKKQGDV